MSNKRVLAFISDMHIGSRYALFPTGMETPQGNKLKLNWGQKKLLGYWHSFWNWCDHWKVDTIIDCGDNTHGTNHKEGGANLMDVNLSLQKEAYIKLVEPHLGGRDFFTLTGSKYHESIDSNVQFDLAKRLKGKYLGAIANLHLKGTRRVINVAHGVGGAMIYRATVMDREGLFQLASMACDRIPKIDVIVRGHLHNFIHLHLPHQHIIQLPCWVAYEPNKIMLKSYGKMQPDIGGCVLFVDDEDRITVHHYLYPSPRIDDFIRNV